MRKHPSNLHDIPMPPAIAAALQVNRASGISYPHFGVAEFRADKTRTMEALLAKIATWLSTDFDLPAIGDLPRVEFASPMKLMAMRYKGLLPDQWREDGGDPAMQAAQERDVVAVYNDKSRTIFLPDAWTGTTPAELSVLVHEMVHHLQNLAGLSPSARHGKSPPTWRKINGSSCTASTWRRNSSRQVHSFGQLGLPALTNCVGC